MEIRQITKRILRKIFADGFTSSEDTRNYYTQSEARYEAQTNPFRQLAEDTTCKPDESAVNDDLKMTSFTYHVPLAAYLKTKFSPYSN